MGLLKLYKVPLLLALLSFLYSYFRFPKQDVNGLKKIIHRGDHPLILGHRAGQFEAPENTLVAIETAKRNGATAVEIDLEFSKDGVPILFHDDDVKRVTNGEGKVADLLYYDLLKLNAAATFNYTITKDGKKNVVLEKIPTFMEAVDLCRKHGLIIDLDVKSNGKKTCRALTELLKKYPDAPSFIFVTSFFPNIIFHIRNECPQFFVGLLWHSQYLSYSTSGEPKHPWYIMPVANTLDYILDTFVHYVFPDFFGLSLVALHKDQLSTRNINFWRRKDVELITWTVNDPMEKQYFLKKHRIPIVTDSLLNSA